MKVLKCFLFGAAVFGGLLVLYFFCGGTGGKENEEEI